MKVADKWNLLHKRQVWKPQRRPSKEIIALAKSFKRNNVRNILDIGCGINEDDFYLSDNGFSVTAIDTSNYAINECKKRAKQKRKNIIFLRRSA